MATSEAILQKGMLLGKLPGMKEWNMYYIEVTPTHLHILDGQRRKHLRSLEIDNSDMAGEDTKKKGEFRFYLLRTGDGKYTFRCDSPQDKTTWITQLQRVIHKQTLNDTDGSTSDTLSPIPPATRTRGKASALDMPLPSAPGTSSPRASVISTDSGFGPSGGGMVKKNGRGGGIRSAPSSGGARFVRGEPASTSEGTLGRPPVQILDDSSEMGYEKCKWFWNTTSRQEAERRLLSEGKIGNFIVRINASGHFVMTYWRKDGIHHHKIINHGTIFRFEKSAVEAEGESLVDLLDTYMKANSSKTKPMEPFGGALYDMYNYAWTPPAVDMNVLQERLKQQKQMREVAAKASRRPNQYAPVEVSSSPESSSREDSGSATFNPSESTSTKPLPPTPSKKPQRDNKSSSSVEVTSKPKALPSASKNSKKFLDELQKATKTNMKPPTSTKPKPGKMASHSTPASQTTPSTSYEAPEYANCTFGPGATQAPTSPPPPPPEEENMYMNIHAMPTPPSRKPRGNPQSQSNPSEYQNIGNHKPKRKV